MTQHTMEMDKKIVFRTIEPKEGENTHIESHEAINRNMVQIGNYLTEIQEELLEVKDFSTRAAEHSLAAFSEIREDFNKKIGQIRKDIDKVNETLGCMAEEIKELKDKSEQGRKYLVKHFEGILDTDTEIVSELDKIELDGTYLVNIVENSITKNDSTTHYDIGHTVIANNEYTPKVYIKSKIGGHAVFEYDFTVILTEI